LYNFDDKPVDATMRLWRLASGRYDMTQGPDRNDDGVIDESAQKQSLELSRFSTIAVTVPPQENTLLILEQSTPSEQSEGLPDLAVGPKDVRQDDDGTIHVMVHNIGSAPAGAFGVSLVDPDENVTESVSIDQLDTPNPSLQAQRQEITFSHKSATRGWYVVLDLEDEIDEILEVNNRQPVP
jgi:hypothetical protein